MLILQKMINADGYYILKPRILNYLTVIPKLIELGLFFGKFGNFGKFGIKGD